MLSKPLTGEMQVASLESSSKRMCSRSMARTRLRRAGELLGIPLLDHVVVAEQGFVSLREKGWMTGDPESPGGKEATGSS